MIRRALVPLVAILSFVLAPAASAQSDKPVQLHVFGGWSPIAGDASTYIDDGWDIAFGGVWHPNPQRPLGLRFDLAYDWWNVPTGNLPAGDFTVDNGDANNWSLRAGLQFDSHNQGRAHFSGGIGLGGYSVHGRLTNSVVVPGYICDPWWGWCYPGLVEGDSVVASKTTTKLGYYATVGAAFDTSGAGQVFVEAQYHYVTLSHTLEYWPIVVGYRW